MEQENFCARGGGRNRRKVGRVTFCSSEKYELSLFGSIEKIQGGQSESSNIKRKKC